LNGGFAQPLLVSGQTSTVLAVGNGSYSAGVSFASEKLVLILHVQLIGSFTCNRSDAGRRFGLYNDSELVQRKAQF